MKEYKASHDPRFTIMGSRCNDMVSYCLFRHFFALEIDANTRR